MRNDPKLLTMYRELEKMARELQVENEKLKYKLQSDTEAYEEMLDDLEDENTMLRNKLKGVK